VAGTIIADVIQSDQSYPSSINIASPVIISNTFAFPAGTVSAPAFFPTGDTNTGIFFPAADTMAFAEGGVEAMRINDSGEVLVGGTTSINATSGAITLQRTDATPTLGLFRNDTTISVNNVLGAISWYGNDTTSNTPTEHAYIAAFASGTHAAGDNPTDLVFGTTQDNTATVAESFRVTSGGTAYVTLKTLTYTPTVALGTPGGLPGVIINTNEATPKQYDLACNGDSLTFRREGVERMRIDSSGNVLVGTTSQIIGTHTHSLGVSAPGTNTPISTLVNATVSRFAIDFHNPNGRVGDVRTLNSGTSYNTSSDYRLKENIAPMTGALAKVAQLKPCTWSWKVDGSDGQGFVAHELQEVIPDCVTGTKDETSVYIDEEGNEQTSPLYQGVDTSFLVATLTAAIQELKAKNDALESRIAALEESQP
jgi:hypothetical protein